MKVNKVLEKILSGLRARTQVGGLEISDTALRFAYFKDEVLQATALRLPPGIVENGGVKNYPLLIEALKKLRQQIPEHFHKKKLINVIMTLGSVRIYTKVFSLPFLEGNNLEDAIQLNIRMISPVELSQTYAGWQLVNENRGELKIEILTAFINKVFIDQLDNALKEGGFLPIAVESGALSLARLIRERAVEFEIDKFYLVVNIDDDGLQFLILRRGQLHFEYFHSWSDIRGEAREISWSDFEATIKRTIHQVLNFYGTRWPEPLTEVFLSTNSLEEEISKIIRENFSLQVKELRVRFEQPIRKEWFEVAGSALRAKLSRAKDQDINLFGISVQEEFRRWQMADFLKFWQLLLPVSFSVLLVTILSGYWFLINLNHSLKVQSLSMASDKQVEEISSLEAKIKDFNRSVALISSIQQSSRPKTPLMDKMNGFMSRAGLILDRFYLLSGGLPLTLSGEAKSQDQILNFKNALTADPSLNSVNLLLSDIKPQDNGFSFSINFMMKE